VFLYSSDGYVNVLKDYWIDNKRSRSFIPILWFIISFKSVVLSIDFLTSVCHSLVSNQAKRSGDGKVVLHFAAFNLAENAKGYRKERKARKLCLCVLCETLCVPNVNVA